MPRKNADNRLQELRWRYDLNELAEARRHLDQRLQSWQSLHRKPCERVEANSEETFCPAPATNTSSRPTNLIKQLNPEIRHPTLLVRIFSDEAS